MIPRRLLFLLTALVLALHALLLSGASASNRRPTASAPPVFETRTIRAPVAAKAPSAPVASAKPKRAKPLPRGLGCEGRKKRDWMDVSMVKLLMK